MKPQKLPGESSFTALFTDDKRLAALKEDLICVSRHRTRGVPDRRYLDLADQMLHQGERRGVRPSIEIDPVVIP
jgi:hypothetical protein